MNSLKKACLKSELLEIETLEAVELKFLLKLLESEEQRSPIAALKPNSRTSLAKCDRICHSLSEKGLVEYDAEIFRFTISAPGRMLLTLQTTSLPVTPDELKLLRVCKGSMTAEKLGGCVPIEGRSQLISGLVARKLLKVTKKAIQEVRLTEIGKAFLAAYQAESIGSKSA